jgi:methionyl-tRNA synthetase
MKKKILVTSALPYANGPIHVGHIIEYIQADVFVRFLRLKGEDVIYVCADDTHGTPIQINAEKAGVSPEKFIRRFFKEHTRDFNEFLVSFDNYYSTNSPENKKYSDLFFNTMKKDGYIYTKEIGLTYCPKCKRFLPDRYVKGKCPRCGAEDQYGDVCEKCNAAYKTTELIRPYCAVCSSTPTRKTSKHYFFKLSNFSGKLKKWLTNNKKLQPEIRNFALNWIREGLEDWDISRDGPYFGFKIPGETDKYYYVWLDAPIGYIASTANYCKKHNKKAESYWKSRNARIIHFIGKDITYFHLLFWPAMLMATGFNLPERIVVHGFVNVNKAKMSKSRGTLLTAREFLQKEKPEYLRFYYASAIGKRLADIDFSEGDFKEKVNNALVSNLANFIYRSLSFINKSCGSKIASVNAKKDAAIIKSLNIAFKKAEKAYEECNLKEAVRALFEASSKGNQYFQKNAPWQLIKKDKKRCGEVLALSANLAKNLSVLVSPVLPNFAKEVKKQLNIKKLELKDVNFKLKNHKINKARIIFTKTEKNLFEEKETFPLNLKVAEVLSAEKHPNADKLLILKISLGAEQRQIVAGLKDYYSNDEFIGKKVVVVTNMKPAMLRGIESNGMLLAAEKSNKVRLLEAPSSAAGDKVYLDELKNSEKEVTIEEFSKIKMTVKDKRVIYKGKMLRTDNEEIVADIADGAKVK